MGPVSRSSCHSYNGSPYSDRTSVERWDVALGSWAIEAELVDKEKSVVRKRLISTLKRPWLAVLWFCDPGKAT
jgi:hypothetical protein